MVQLFFFLKIRKLFLLCTHSVSFLGRTRISPYIGACLVPDLGSDNVERMHAISEIDV